MNLLSLFIVLDMFNGPVSMNLSVYPPKFHGTCQTGKKMPT